MCRRKHRAPGLPQESLVRDETRTSLLANTSLTRALCQLCVAPRTSQSRLVTMEPGREPRVWWHSWHCRTAPLTTAPPGRPSCWLRKKHPAMKPLVPMPPSADGRDAWRSRTVLPYLEHLHGYTDQDDQDDDELFDGAGDISSQGFTMPGWVHEDGLEQNGYQVGCVGPGLWLRTLCVNGTDTETDQNHYSTTSKTRSRSERLSSSSSNPSRKGVSTYSRIRKLSNCKQQ